MTATITQNPILEFTIPKATGEFTARMTNPHPTNNGDLLVGIVKWDGLTINGKAYDSTSVRVLYIHGFDGARDFEIDLGFNSYEKYTDSARRILKRGIYAALEDAGLLVPPTMEDISAELLEAAYHAGNAYGEKFDSAIAEGFDRLIRDWHGAYDVLTGERHREIYSLPNVAGIPSMDELKAEFLAAAQAAIGEALESVEARISKTDAA